MVITSSMLNREKKRTKCPCLPQRCGLYHGFVPRFFWFLFLCFVTRNSYPNLISNMFSPVQGVGIPTRVTERQYPGTRVLQHKGRARRPSFVPNFRSLFLLIIISHEKNGPLFFIICFKQHKRWFVTGARGYRAVPKSAPPLMKDINTFYGTKTDIVFY